MRPDRERWLLSAARDNEVELTVVGGHRLGTQGTTFERFVASAIDIVDEQGIDALVMRELALRTHYSVSTVSYHVTPWAMFVTHVWDSVRLDAAERLLPPPPIDDPWFQTVARRTLAWADEHPTLAQFLVSHFPHPDQELGRSPAVQGIWRELGMGDAPPARAASQTVIRHVQSLIEVAIHVGGEAGVTLLAEQLRHQFAQWHRLYLQVVDATERATAVS
jgi:hypothetical protein